MMSEISQDQAQNPQESAPSIVAQRPGLVFTAQRHVLGMSVAEVSAKLKLSKRQIEALESDDYASLPGNTFVRGFVRNYARLLELDPQPLIQFLDQHLPKETVQAALPRLRDEALPVLRPEGRSPRSGFLIAMFLSLGLVMAAAGAYWYYQHANGVEPELMLSHPVPVNAVSAAPEPVVAQLYPSAVAAVASTPNGNNPDPAPTESPVISPAVSAPPANLPGNPPPLQIASPAAASTSIPSTAISASPAPAIAMSNAVLPAEAANTDLRVLAKQDSWVQITDAKGRRLVNELLTAGQSRSVGGTPPYKVRIGNGPHTDLFYKGKQTDLAPYIKVDVANLELN